MGCGLWELQYYCETAKNYQPRGGSNEIAPHRRVVNESLVHLRDAWIDLILAHGILNRLRVIGPEIAIVMSFDEICEFFSELSGGAIEEMTIAFWVVRQFENFWVR